MTRHASASPPDAGDPLRPGASDSAGVRAEITEKMLLSAARLAKIGYWVWDHRRNACVYCSDELAAIHQLSPEAYRERFGDPERMLDWFHPADREQYRETWEQEACRGVAYTVDVRTLRTDGSTVHVRETGQPIFDDDGQLIYTAGTLQDISEFTLAYQRARIAEERLKDAIEALPDGFVLFDNQHCLIQSNSRFRSYWRHAGVDAPGQGTRIAVSQYRNRLISLHVHQRMLGHGKVCRQVLLMNRHGRQPKLRNRISPGAAACKNFLHPFQGPEKIDGRGAGLGQDPD